MIFLLFDPTSFKFNIVFGVILVIYLIMFNNQLTLKDFKEAFMKLMNLDISRFENWYIKLYNSKIIRIILIILCFVPIINIIILILAMSLAIFILIYRIIDKIDR